MEYSCMEYSRMKYSVEIILLSSNATVDVA